MKIAIFGCRDGEYLQKQIRQNAGLIYETVCFCDNNKEKYNSTIEGVPIVSIDNLVELFNSGKIEGVIVAVRKGFSRYCIIEQLKNYGINNIILLRPSVLTFRLPIIFNRTNPEYHRHWVHLKECKKPIIHHLEAHAADGCNLNCKGCLHFSNLLPKDQFPDLKALLEDIKEINKHCEIFQFRVLGGEPLLSKDLPDFLSELRRILPYSDIAVISNGILIPQMKEELFGIMADNSIGFNLTLYPPTLALKDKIEAILNSFGVPFGSHVAKIDEFEKFMTLEKHEGKEYKAYQVCEPRGILVLKDGRLFKCPIEAYGKVYVDTFDIHYQVDWNGIDIYEKNNDWDSIVVDLTDKTIDLCAYCSDKSEYFSWSVGQPEKNDWLVSGNKL